MMAEYMPLHAFKAIYVVDLCKSLCEQARPACLRLSAAGCKQQRTGYRPQLQL